MISVGDGVPAYLPVLQAFLIMALPLPSRVVVCSKNPVKVEAVRQAFRKALPHLKLDFLGESSAGQ